MPFLFLARKGDFKNQLSWSIEDVSLSLESEPLSPEVEVVTETNLIYTNIFEKTKSCVSVRYCGRKNASTMPSPVSPYFSQNVSVRSRFEHGNESFLVSFLILRLTFWPLKISIHTFRIHSKYHQEKVNLALYST